MASGLSTRAAIGSPHRRPPPVISASAGLQIGRDRPACAAAEARIPPRSSFRMPSARNTKAAGNADKRSHATPGLDARETTRAGLDREGVTGLADRQPTVGQQTAPANPTRDTN